jgi:hypothetical protein
MARRARVVRTRERERGLDLARQVRALERQVQDLGRRQVGEARRPEAGRGAGLGLPGARRVLSALGRAAIEGDPEAVVRSVLLETLRSARSIPGLGAALSLATGLRELVDERVREAVQARVREAQELLDRRVDELRRELEARTTPQALAVELRTRLETEEALVRGGWLRTGELLGRE